MSKSIRKIVAILLLITMFFSFQQISVSALQTVKPVTTSSATRKWRELTGYYNIKTLNDLKKAVKNAEKTNDAHPYTLKKNITLEEPLVLNGYLDIEGNGYKITSSTYDGSKGVLFKVGSKGYLSLSNITITGEKTSLISNNNYLFLKKVTAHSNGKYVAIQNQKGASCEIYGGKFTANKNNILILYQNSKTKIDGSATFNAPNNNDIWIAGPYASIDFYSATVNDIYVVPGKQNYIYNHNNKASIGKIEPAFNFLFPVPKYTRVSSEWSKNRTLNGVTKPHGGIDIAAPKGNAIVASEAGTVVHVKNDADGYGLYLTIKHEEAGKTYYTRYAHCSRIVVKAGQTVSRGTKIAEVGSTGNSTGPHLHFEIRTENDYKFEHTLNPRPYIIDAKPLYLY